MIHNPKTYNERATTNIRLEPDIKKKLKQMAQEQDKSMSDIINDLVERFIAKGE